ncbi:phosphodiesterase YaeI [Beggiatoa leptomitoformis]|uniref:Phosphodiesterase YaeI n=1 Tax=Beggiatoa leptomitoformis TaxID=288004 RepID=A0A2N9YFL1_9GAMM|nr:phosphodiesterase YaeI [Beggiatoa leptomitoformis]ALG68415.1 phosphodiesterase YaeI [Beggiatoa leptomitoformis]AUI69257.1 phosphodiesterase YaeI [Beggiatoa leptomitoformis]
MLSRRQLLRMGFYGSLISGLGYSYFIEPRWLKVSLQTIPCDMPAMQPITVLHLSDFHASNAASLDLIEKACALAVQIPADCICLTGDYISTHLTDAKRYSDILHRLSNHAPTVACLGNHDGGEWAIEHHGYANTDEVRALLQTAGIRLLHNQAMQLTVSQQVINLVGLGDVWAGECDPQKAFKAFAELSPQRRLTILLSHNPDTKDFLMDYPWDLLLCGHTHGGQFVIPLTNSAPFAPVLDKAYVYGVYPLGKRHLHITSGVGNLYGLRFNCRPEISVLHLVSALNESAGVSSL